MRLEFRKYGRVYGVAALLLVLTFSVQGSPLSLVLCIKADGHAEVKTACGCSHGHALNEASQTAQSSPLLLTSADFNDPCGPCVDVHISIGTGVPTARVQDFSPSVRVSMSEAGACLHARIADTAADIPSEVSLMSHPPPFDSSPVSLQTVILLC
jgi:hypothetical protein